MKSIKRKLKSVVGFTLAETLMTVLILLMVASIMAAGIPAAARAYTNAVDAANAQALLSNAVNALRSELSTAWGVSADSNVISYYSANTGSKCTLSCDGSSVKIQEYSDNAEEGVEAKTPPSSRDLVTNGKKPQDDKLSVIYESADYSDGIVSIDGLQVIKAEPGGNTRVVAEMPEDDYSLLIHVISGGE